MCDIRYKLHNTTLASITISTIPTGKIKLSNRIPYPSHTTVDNSACLGVSRSATDGPSSSIQKGRILSMQYPSKREGKELKIVVQPETQHRARYLTEGSRGSVKDRTQQGFPTVKVRLALLQKVPYVTSM